MKTITIIGVILCTSVAFAINNTSPTQQPIQTATNVVEPPQVSALNIMTETLSTLKKLKNSGQANAQNVKILVQTKLLSNVDISTTAALSLKKYWHKLTLPQQSIFKQYITQSLLKDYTSILATYDKLDKLRISADPKVKRQDNKAIVKLIVHIDDTKEPVIITLKMIQTNQWRIYDMVFSGVSLIKNYQAQFNAQIHRKGLENLVAKITKKIK